jgi:hypothetical protein
MYIVTVELIRVIICFENAEGGNVNRVLVEISEKKRPK